MGSKRKAQTPSRKRKTPKGFPEELSPSQLRWRCSIQTIEKILSNDGAKGAHIIGQDRALRALRFGMEMKQFGYNIFVTGVNGTGRTTAVKHLLADFARTEAVLTDKCYVHNFRDPDTPRMIDLPAGQGSRLKSDMNNFVVELRKGVPSAFESRRYQEQRKSLMEHFQNRQRIVLKDFERKVKERGFEVVQIQSGPGMRPEIAPVIDGSPATLDQIHAKVESGEVTPEQQKSLEADQSNLEGQMELVMREMRNIERKAKKSVEDLNQKIINPLVLELMDDLRSKYTTEKVRDYFNQVEEDVLSNIGRFQTKDEQPPSVLGIQVNPEEDDYTEYNVNVIVDNSETKGRPVIIETNPRYKNLFGTIERNVDKQGSWQTDFTHIKAGSLLKADGGFLVLNIIDVAIEPWVWSTLKRVLRNAQTEIQPPESSIFGASSGLKPEPMGFNVKVIIIGDASIYSMLYDHDEDFKKIFRVRADFDVEMKLDDQSISSYVAFVHSVCAEEELPSFEPGALAEIIEHGVRVAGDQRKLSTRFNVIANVVREAAYWASKEHASSVTREHVECAIQDRIERLNLVEQKIQSMITDGTIMIDTAEARVGQVNGLSVYQMGEYEFGKPSRITVKTSVGNAGIINIEREAEMSGPVHNKGVLILGGYLRSMYAQHKILMLSASIAFEQSYSGVDGDSASATEVFAILSSLSEIPLRQDIAVTGSINQHGEVQPIGGVNQKVEGFFDVCKERGLTGTQGVLIPHQNVKDLVLRNDVVESVRKKQFHIYPMHTIDEGIALLTGKPAGVMEKSGHFSRGSIHALVNAKLAAYARQGKKQTARRKRAL